MTGLAGARVLVTGGAGTVGSTLVDQVLEAGAAQVAVLDNLVRGRLANLDDATASGRLDLVIGDIRDRDLVHDVTRGCDLVFHQAAIRITQCAEEPRLALEVLVDGTFNVLEAAADVGVDKVVAASSAFPPFLSPTVLRFEEDDYTPGSGLDLQRTPFTTRVILADGGVYDNLGLETAWKNYHTVLVSDGGGRIAAKGTIGRDYVRHTLRVLDSVDNQVRSLRKRQLLDSFQLDESHPNHRRGTYWGTYSDIRDYRAPDAFDCPVEQTMKLARIPTRLARMPARQQEQLINWGFAISDAALRRWVDPSLTRPDRLPYPEAGVG